LALNLDPYSVFKEIHNQAKQINKSSISIWGNISNRFHHIIEDIVPNDISKMKPLAISITTIKPYPSNLLVSKFKSKNDLIEALYASCFIPGYMEKRPFTRFRGKPCLD
jgi:predicted acylesterase/phospholipase RssA